MPEAKAGFSLAVTMATTKKEFSIVRVRKELKDKRGTLSQCIKYLLQDVEDSAELKKVMPKKADCVLLMPHIYETMGIGKEYVTIYKGAETTRVRKCSVDLVARYFINRANGDIEDVLPALKAARA